MRNNIAVIISSVIVSSGYQSTVHMVNIFFTVYMAQNIYNIGI